MLAILDQVVAMQKGSAGNTKVVAIQKEVLAILSSGSVLAILDQVVAIQREVLAILK